MNLRNLARLSVIVLSLAVLMPVSSHAQEIAVDGDDQIAPNPLAETSSDQANETSANEAGANETGNVQPPDESPTVSSSKKIDSSIIDQDTINNIRGYLANEILTYSVNNQNKKHNAMDEASILRLDKKWREEADKTEKPLIASKLSSPLSSYLTRIQAQSKGLFTEIIIMDNKGLNVGQSNITTDYWQGDEAKWEQTYLKGANAIFIDEAEFNDEIGVWVSQLNLSVTDFSSGQVIGAATFEINLTELARRQSLGL